MYGIANSSNSCYFSGVKEYVNYFKGYFKVHIISIEVSILEKSELQQEKYAYEVFVLLVLSSSMTVK